MIVPSKRRRATNKPRPQEDHIPESIFDALNSNPPTGSEAARKEPKEPKGDVVTMDALQKQLTDLHTRLEQSERANMALSAPPPTQVQVQQLVEPVFDVANLPDPVMDKDGYAKELTRRQMDYQSKVADFNKAKTAQSQPVQGNSEVLWEDFTETYGAYSEDQEGLEFAVGKVLKNAARRGIDANRYMYQNSDRFFRDVVKVYDARFGKPEDEENVEVHPSPAQRNGRAASRRDVDQNADDLHDEGRTGGIFGGIDTSGNRRSAPAQAGDMMKDLQDIQRKTGYF